MKHTFLAAVFLSMATAAFADEDDIPKPQHPISECRKQSDNKACLKASWQEYRAAILSELKNWQQLEGVAKRGDVMEANVALGRAMRGGWYVHNHWDPIVPEADETDVINFDDAEAIFACRTAIIDLKYWLVGVTHDDYSDGAKDSDDYAQDLRGCAKRTK